jgi:hypothetical protein
MRGSRRRYRNPNGIVKEYIYPVSADQIIHDFAEGFKAGSAYDQKQNSILGGLVGKWLTNP